MKILMAGITMQYKSDWEKREDIGIFLYPQLRSFLSPLESEQDSIPGAN